VVRRLFQALTFVFFLATALPASAAEPAIALEQLKLLAVSVEDGRAVLLMPDRRLLELTVGQVLPGGKIRLVKMMDGTAVFDDSSGPNHEHETVWLPINGSLKRFRASVDVVPSRQQPAVIDAPSDGRNGVLSVRR
jgi:hypothetical protein